MGNFGEQNDLICGLVARELNSFQSTRVYLRLCSRVIGVALIVEILTDE